MGFPEIRKQKSYSTQYASNCIKTLENSSAAKSHPRQPKRKDSQKSTKCHCSDVKTATAEDKNSEKSAYGGWIIRGLRNDEDCLSPCKKVLLCKKCKDPRMFCPKHRVQHMLKSQCEVAHCEPCPQSEYYNEYKKKPVTDKISFKPRIQRMSDAYCSFLPIRGYEMYQVLQNFGLDNKKTKEPKVGKILNRGPLHPDQEGKKWETDVERRKDEATECDDRDIQKFKDKIENGTVFDEKVNDGKSNRNSPSAIG